MLALVLAGTLTTAGVQAADSAPDGQAGGDSLRIGLSMGAAQPFDVAQAHGHTTSLLFSAHVRYPIWEHLDAVLRVNYVFLRERRPAEGVSLSLFDVSLGPAFRWQIDRLSASVGAGIAMIRAGASFREHTRALYMPGATLELAGILDVTHGAYIQATTSGTLGFHRLAGRPYVAVTLGVGVRLDLAGN